MSIVNQEIEGKYGISLETIIVLMEKRKTRK